MKVFDVKITLDDQEVETLRQCRDKVNKDGFDWSFEQVLQELSVIGLSNWKTSAIIQKAIEEKKI